MNQTEHTYLKHAWEYALKKTEENAQAFAVDFPSACSVGLQYQPVPNATTELGSDWTAGFFTGMLWLAYEVTGEEQFLNRAKEHTNSFNRRLEQMEVLGHHDIGFLYSLSCLADYRVTGDTNAKQTAVQAAYALLGRYQPNAGILQQNGDMQEPSPFLGRFIIDSLMNLPLLFWAGEATGDGSFREKANRHLAQVKRYLFRPDGSTIQVCRLDIKTGELVEQGTHQGLNAHSCWSRGQAWGIYGMALAYRYTGDAQCLAYSKQAADYFLAHLPEDGMCAWDFALTEPDTPKDTSAAAIAACGLLELARQLPLADDMRQRYERAAVDLLLVLAGRHTTANVPESNGILLHGRYTDDSVDECMIWGDYFYMEALVRALRPWRMYW